MIHRELVYGVTFILLYHVYQILLFSHRQLHCDDGGKRLLLKQQQQQQPGGGNATGNVLMPMYPDGQPSEVGIRKSADEIKSHNDRTDSSTRNSSSANLGNNSHGGANEYRCTRWNVTYSFPRQPAFIIVGTQKGGTSALATVLDHHPLVESSHYFEPHFFDFDETMLHYRTRLNDPEAMCRVLREYLLKNFNVNRLRRYPGLIAFEKTPAYILTPNAPARIRAVVPWAKIVVALRNPVDRLVSQHKMTVERGWDNRSFAEAVSEDLNVMRHEGYWLPQHRIRDPFQSSRMGAPRSRLLRKYKTEGMLYRGLYARQLLPWLEHYKLGEELLVVRYEELRDDPVPVLERVLDFVGAPPYSFPDDMLNKSYSPRSSSWLTDYRPNITQEAREYLREFYKPYNDELVALLGEEWRGVWDNNPVPPPPT
jgi:hypothetical protein